MLFRSDRIEVCEDCRIQIRFKYQDSYERALSFIESVEKIQLLSIASGAEAIAPRKGGDVGWQE